MRGPGLADGDRFAGRYRIRRHLGDGGMGAVFLADDELLGEGVALKVAARAGADHASDDDADDASRQRQRREVSLARRVTHPNVARVFDLGVDDGRLYITMEHVPGTSLRSRVRSGPLPVDDVASIGHQVASALAAAHDAGVVHLDLKPDNVVVVDGAVLRAVLVDFGVSRALGERATGAGTLDYMAPEQLGDEAIGGAADVYALGLLLYELLTGVRPFQGAGDTGMDRAFARLTKKPAVLGAPVPPDLASLVDACLSRQAGDRPSAHTVERELARRLARGASMPGERLAPAGTSAVDVAALPKGLGLKLAEARAALAVGGDELDVLPAIDEVLQQAPDLDVAIAARALTLVRAWHNALATDDVADLAVVAVSEALARAPHLADAHLADALIADASGDIAYAVRALRRALARDPLHAFSHEILGRLELEGGIADDQRLRVAFALDSNHLACPVHIAREHFFHGRDADGLALLDDVDSRRHDLTRESRLLRMRWCLWHGDRPLARALLAQLPNDAHPTTEGIRLVLAHVAGDVGVDDVARQLEAMLALPTSPKRRAFLTQIFVEVLARHDVDGALQRVLSVVQLPLSDLRWLDGCPALAPLRAAPAFRIARATVLVRLDEAFGALPVAPVPFDEAPTEADRAAQGTAR